ncbi:MAG TPA: alanine racemase, partial [Candidatus Limnocylindrales bacterium]
MTIDERLVAAGLPALARRVWLEIDLEALTNNLQAIRDHVGPDVEINAVVKADAYGHGLVPVARHFAASGAQRLCVASLDEALVVRGAGIATPILVMFSIPVDAVARAAQSRIEIVASDAATIEATLQRWRTCTTSGADVLAVHIEVETGLTRGGLMPDAVAGVARMITATPRTRVAGIWTHLATPEDEATSDAQEEVFATALGSLRAAGIEIPPRHLAATGGLLIAEQSYEGIRPGLALYGIVPDSLAARGRQAQLA